MKKTTKYALLVASALAVASSAQAQYIYGDLLAGFTGGSGNDTIVDLGQVSSLTLGETWHIGAGLGTQFGVVGASSIAAGSHIYATSADINQFGFTMGNQWTTAKTAVQTIDQGITLGQSRTVAYNDASGTSWYTETAQPTGTSGPTLFFNAFGEDPNAPVGSFGSSTTAYLFDNVNGIATRDSFFSYDTASGNLAFGAVAVPEPSTLSLLGGFGLLALALRRQRIKV